MTPQQATTPNSAVILERIEGIRSDVAEIKTSLACFNDREIAFEKDYAKEHTSLAADVRQANEMATRAHKRIDDLEGQMRTIGEAVKPLIFQSKILAWAATVIGGAMVVGALSFLWAVATHQIVITTIGGP
jgi:hypothetical protein